MSSAAPEHPTLGRMHGPAALVPDLVFVGPDCPDGCGEECYDGASWRCETCGATWFDDGTGGEREPVDVGS